MALLQHTQSWFTVRNEPLKVGDFSKETDTGLTKIGNGKPYKDISYTNISYDSLGKPISASALQDANSQDTIEAGTGITITGTGTISDPYIINAPDTGTVTDVSATSPLTSTGGSTPDISTSMATNKLIGRGTAGVGVMEEITLGTGLSLTGNTLNASAVTPASLTKTDDTNVTLTLGGTPLTALLQAVSLTLGWTGTLADGRIASAGTWNAKQVAYTILSTLGALANASGVLTNNGSGTLSWVSPTTGTVTTLSVTTANGVSGTVANPTTTPAITITLGVITPTSVNGITLSGSGSLANSGTTALTAFTGSGTSSGTNTGDNAVNSLYAGLVKPLTFRGGGTFYYSPNFSSTTTSAFATGILYAMPFYVGTSTTFTKLTLVVTIGGVLSTIRTGIYSDTNGKPDALVYDAGAVASTAAGNITNTLGTPQTLSAGWYWLACVTQAVVCTIQAANGNNVNQFANVPTTDPYSNGPMHGYSQTGITGGLPSPWGATLTPTQVCPIVWLTPQ